MSEHEKIAIYGPKPRPDNTRITGYCLSETGEVLLSVAKPKNLRQEYWMSEIMVHDAMRRYQRYAENPLYNDPEFLADVITEADIFHYGLATVQAEKIERGQKLNTPLMLHPLVEMELPMLSGVPVPDGP